MKQPEENTRKPLLSWGSPFKGTWKVSLGWESVKTVAAEIMLTLCLCPVYGCHAQCQRENRVEVYAVFSTRLVLEKWLILSSVMFLLFILIYFKTKALPSVSFLLYRLTENMENSS